MSVKSKLIIGSRASKLALTQSRFIKSELEKHHPALQVEIKEIQTQGDKILDVALSKIGDKGLFVKELENELLAHTIDLAVHSMKDMLTALPEGLEIICATHREDIRDVLCHSKNFSGEIKRIGTSSLRRIAQLKRKFPNAEFLEIRGNVDTRLRKLDDPNEGLDAIVLAAAGLKRLAKEDRITEYLDPTEILPAVSQGALAIEISSNREDVKKILEPIRNAEEEQVVKGERAFLRTLEGGCQVPIGVYAEKEAEKLTYTGIVISLDGQTFAKDSVSTELQNTEAAGKELAQSLLRQGAGKILENIKLNQCSDSKTK